MPETEEQQQEMIGKIWQNRISASDKAYKDWSDRFQTETLENFYSGIHHDETIRKAGYFPYISNRFGVAIDIKLPTLLFTNPQFEITPKPSKVEFEEAIASENAQLRTDVLNQIASDPDLNLVDEASLAILDANTSYGLLEVGYDADWIANPNAGKPILNTDIDLEESEEDSEIEKEPKLLSKNERIFYKRIISSRFRVSVDSHKLLKRCRWFGYWEFVNKAALIANNNYDTKDLSLNTVSTDVARTSDVSNHEHHVEDKEADQTKLWKIWDVHDRKILFIPDGVNRVIREKSFKRISIFPLKFKDLHKGFYPKPPASDWLPSQREINEIGESASLHRKRAVRKYVVPESAFDDEKELEKLQLNQDMTIVKTIRQSGEGVVVPIQDANLGAQHHEMRAVAVNDFDMLAGISAEKRGETSQTTATQAAIVDKSSGIRDSRDVNTTANWFNLIGRETLLIVIEKFTSAFWVKVTAEDSEMEPVEEIVEKWRQITSEDLGDEDFNINISLRSLSPVANDMDKRKFIEFLSIVTQFPIVSMSPALVRETANQVGYRNNRAIRVMEKLAQAVQLGQIAQAEQTLQQSNTDNSQGEGNQLAQREVAQNTPQDLEQIRNELGNFSTQTQ